MDARRMDAIGPELETTLTLLHVSLKEQPNLDNLLQPMLRIYAQVMEALSGIRATRDLIQAHSPDGLRATHARISEVNSTTENAAMELLNGLDRAQALIDQLQAGGNAESVVTNFDLLRNEVNQLYGCLQFQDIITQQLHGVSAHLAEVEQQMEQVASLFDEQLGLRKDGSATTPVALPDPRTFNAQASMQNVADRQALIDAAFSIRK